MLDTPETASSLSHSSAQTHRVAAPWHLQHQSVIPYQVFEVLCKWDSSTRLSTPGWQGWSWWSPIVTQSRQGVNSPNEPTTNPEAHGAGHITHLIIFTGTEKLMRGVDVLLLYRWGSTGRAFWQVSALPGHVSSWDPSWVQNNKTQLFHDYL